VTKPKDSPDGVRHVKPEPLRALIGRLFTAAGAPPADAATVAEVLVEADLRGVESHGSTRVAGYISMIRLGLLNPRPKVQVLRETQSTAMLEGDQGFGIVVARQAMEMAIDKGRGAGIACVTARNVTHTGMVGFYPMMAAQRGLIGLSCNNGPTILPPYGGKTPTLATNPFSVAVPAGQEQPIVLDMATSIVAGGCDWPGRRARPSLPTGPSTVTACPPRTRTRPSSTAFSSGRAATRASGSPRSWKCWAGCSRAGSSAATCPP